MLAKDKTIIAAIIGGVAVIVAAVVGGFIPILSNGNDAKHQSSPTQSLATETLNLPFDLDSYYYPSGWMGDGEFGEEHISVSEVPVQIDGEQATAKRFEYLPGPKKWAGIYWQYPDKNWGNVPGRDLVGAHRITFFAKGEEGGEIVEFKSGGITGMHQDTYDVSLGKKVLTADWHPFTIDLSKKDLSNVVGAFAWIVSGTKNKPIIFYVAKLVVE